MTDRDVSLPELFLIAATRGMLGLGAGLLLAEHVDRDHRKIAGTVLVAVGALSTIPLAIRVLGRRAKQDASKRAATLMAD